MNNQVCGVQGMEDATRQRNLQRFRSECQVLVATASLEEGLDVPACRFVIRYDYFSSAKSHVQGAGRARHPEAEIFYFDNDPLLEEERRRRVADACDREACEEYGTPPTSPAHAADAEGPAELAAGAAEGAAEGAASVGLQPSQPQHGTSDGIADAQGSGHAWGEETTLWDYGSNKSFRGMACSCGAVLCIQSRAYGRGRKKKERIFSREGPFLCPLSESEPLQQK